MSRDKRGIATRWQKLQNLRMAEKLSDFDAEDLSQCEKTPEGYYILAGEMANPNRIEGVDFCDSSTESWIWSIGQNKKTGQVLASLDTCFYQNPEYECLWLR